MAETENNPVSSGRRWLGTRQPIHTERQSVAENKGCGQSAGLHITVLANSGHINKRHILTFACICIKKLIKVVTPRGWEGELDAGNKWKRDFAMYNF